MNFRYRFAQFSLFFTFFLLTSIAHPALASSAQQGHFIILVVDQISLADLTNPELVNFKSIIDKGAIGVMNTTTGGAQIPDNAFVTMGAGSRAIGSPAASQAFNAGDELHGEPVSGIYLRRINNPAVGQADIISLTVEQIKTLNDKLHYTVEIGALGEALHQAGLKTCVIGNSDRPPEDAIFPRYVYGRQAAAILMDNHGLVDYGDISTATNYSDLTAPYGIRTDAAKVTQLFRQYYPYSQVMLINFGDTSRTAAYASVLDKDTAAEQLSISLYEADSLLGQLLKNIDLNKDCLAVVVPTPSPIGKKQKDTLTPVIMTGAGINPGLLTSSTTHRSGIVANIDLASTVLNYFHLEEPGSLVGKAMTVQSIGAQEKLSFLTSLKTNLVNNTVRRVPILSTIAYYIAALLILALILTV